MTRDTGEKFDDKDRQEVFLETLRRGVGIMKACQAADVSTMCLLAYRRNHPEFEKEIEDAQKSALLVLEDHLWQMATTPQKGNKQFLALVFWLCNRHPERWRNVARTDVKVEGLEGGVTIQQIVLGIIEAKKRGLDLLEGLAGEETIDIAPEDVHKLLDSPSE